MRTFSARKDGRSACGRIYTNEGHSEVQRRGVSLTNASTRWAAAHTGSDRARDWGLVAGPTSEHLEEIKQLKREVEELR